MIALVTGSTGFLGSHLVEYLRSNGHQVRALVRTPGKAAVLAGTGAELTPGDLASPSSLAAAVAGVDVVFHSAALVTNWAPWRDFVAVSVQGTENLLEAAARAAVKRFVHISTTRVYDDRYCRWHDVITEEAPHGPAGFRPMGSYARAKVLAEAVVQHWRDRLPISIIRPAWIYGPRDEAIVPPLLRFLGSPGARWPGRGDPCADPIYVTDVAACALAAALHPAAVGQAYNATPPQRIGVRAFLGGLCAELGIAMPGRSVPYFLAAAAARFSEWSATLRRSRLAPTINRAGIAILTEDVRYSPAKAERELGWRTQIALADGIRQTGAWLRGQYPELARD